MDAKHSQLTQDLAYLLGFEDGVEDVLDHLLTIESSEVREPACPMSRVSRTKCKPR